MKSRREIPTPAENCGGPVSSENPQSEIRNPKSPHTLCIILARAGSKGLPGKNLADLAGKPMIAHTIEHAKAARCVDRVVVSTDGDAIAQAARAAGVEVISRPADLASDIATVDSAARHAVLAAEERHGVRYDAVVILYANVPLRPRDLIDRSVGKLLATRCDSVQSVCPVGKMHPFWMKKLSGPRGDVLEHYQANNIYRRQDLPATYMLDGGIIAVRRDSLFIEKAGEPHAFLGSDRRAVVSQPGEVVDIDSAVDLEVARAMMAARPRDSAALVPGLCDDRAALDAGTRTSITSRPAAKAVSIRGRRIASDQPVYVIAELGVNHDGSLDRALELTRAAKACGADAIKLQLFDPRLLLSREAALADYQKESADDVFAMLDALQLPVDAMAKVRDLAHELGLAFIVTPFSIELAGAMRELNVDAVKFASPDAVNLPLIEAMLPLGRPLLVSTGTCSFDELRATAALVSTAPAALLHCVSAYPVAMEHANLPRIADLARRFGLPVGYSDHTTQLVSGALAVAQGACLIERHLTYDRAAAGPDHAASLDPRQFTEYVAMIRAAEAAMAADGSRDIEAEVRRLSRQSVCAARAMHAGHVICREDVTVKRPGTGIPAARLGDVVGMRVTRDFAANELLREGDVTPATLPIVESNGQARLSA